MNLKTVICLAISIIATNQPPFALVLLHCDMGTDFFKCPGGIFGTPVGLDPDFWSQRTRTLGLTRDPPESQFQIVNTDNVD